MKNIKTIFFVLVVVIVPIFFVTILMSIFNHWLVTSCSSGIFSWKYLKFAIYGLDLKSDLKKVKDDIISNFNIGGILQLEKFCL